MWRTTRLLLCVAGCAGDASDERVPRDDPEVRAAGMAGDAGRDLVPLDAGSDSARAALPLYRDVPIASGLLRAGIVKQDLTRGRCVRLVLLDGVAPGRLDVRTQPPRMTVERAWITDNLATCHGPGFLPPAGAVVATAATGQVRAQAGGRCLLDVDVTLTFSSDEAWVPPRELLRVGGLESAFACLVQR